MCSSKFCEGCYEKQREIDKLEAEVERLRGKLRYQERTALEEPFGSSTPSSKVLVKPNTEEDKEKRQGGAKPGHKGTGRCSVAPEEADEMIDIPAPERCPDCGGELIGNGDVERTVKDIPAIEVQTIFYQIHRGYCPKCKKTFRASVLPVLPRGMIGNRLLAEAAEKHYVHGIPLGRLEDIWGVNIGTMIGGFHILRNLLKPVMDRLVEEYRQAPVKHADETGWRNNGHNGFAWLFASNGVARFCLRKTRSAEVPREVLGTEPLPGTLVVDRYNAYNKSPCNIEYCYVHLLRDVEDMGKDFPKEEEVQTFVGKASAKLAAAIQLHSLDISDKEYYERAGVLKTEIEEIMNHSAKHPRVQKFQVIFRDHPDRLYHWAADRRVPADNNFAERELRPMVIARKVSFGSQSDEGALTREIILSVLYSMKLRGFPVADRLKNALDHLAGNPQLDPYDLLFNNTS